MDFTRGAINQPDLSNPNTRDRYLLPTELTVTETAQSTHFKVPFQMLRNAAHGRGQVLRER